MWHVNIGSGNALVCFAYGSGLINPLSVSRRQYIYNSFQMYYIYKQRDLLAKALTRPTLATQLPVPNPLKPGVKLIMKM